MDAALPERAVPDGWLPPEQQEGELRPQLLDRFGTSVNVTTMQSIAARTQMVMDCLAFEQARRQHPHNVHLADPTLDLPDIAP